ncbi:MAG: hypothetical protein ACLTC0_14845 [Eisenbergiella massiliensis]|uniref:hypothetical protein n=1 Tax=Eisenbergiella massiliensis TaxID=1720294 RepID=UPI0039936623
MKSSKSKDLRISSIRSDGQSGCASSHSFHTLSEKLMVHILHNTKLALLACLLSVFVRPAGPFHPLLSKAHRRVSSSFSRAVMTDNPQHFARFAEKPRPLNTVAYQRHRKGFLQISLPALLTDRREALQHRMHKTSKPHPDTAHPKDCETHSRKISERFSLLNEDCPVDQIHQEI